MDRPLVILMMAGLVSWMVPTDESFLRRIDDLQRREEERQAELTRLTEDYDARYLWLAQQFEDSQQRLREEMRADAEASQQRLREEMQANAAARDRQLTQRMDESHTRLRDEFQSRDDRLI